MVAHDIQLIGAAVLIGKDGLKHLFVRLIGVAGTHIPNIPGVEQNIDVLRLEQLQGAFEILPVLAAARLLQPLVGGQLGIADDPHAQHALLMGGQIDGLHLLRLDGHRLMHSVGDPAPGREHNGQRHADGGDTELFALDQRQLCRCLSSSLYVLFQNNPSFPN